jgi:hypothetical protein
MATTTLAELADRAQVMLNDAGAGTWPQATVESWICEAIRDYSQTFPMNARVTVSVSGANPGHVFDLFTGIIAVTLVEYPDGESPRVYLKRRDRRNPNFYGTPGYYDIWMTEDQTSEPQLYLSVEPSDGEDIGVEVTKHHPVPASSGTDLTVPMHHECILLLYTLWAAFRERLATEEQDPDTTLAGAVTLLQQLVKGSEQAEAAYRRALAEAKANVSPGGPTGPWLADIHDPIY